MNRTLNWLPALILVGLSACRVDENARGLSSGDLTVSPRGLTADTPNAIGNLGNGLQSSTVTGTYGVASQALVDQHAAMKAQIASPQQLGNINTAAGPTAETQVWASAKNPNELVHFTLVLPERSFSWALLGGAADSDRASLIQERQADLATVQASVISKLSALGGQNIEGMWLANLVTVTLPASFASQLAAWPEIALLEHDAPIHPAGTPGDGFYGSDRRIATHADRLISRGFKGSIGDAASPLSPVRIGSVGWYQDHASNYNSIPPNHPGFEATNLTSRYAQDFVCYTSGYCATDSPPIAQTHDTVVMEVMGGSIEAGQDPSFPGTGTSAQIDRSGIASGATLDYYHAGAANTDSAARSIQAAVDWGIDIVNNSWGTGWITTDPTTDISGLNEFIQNAYNAGVLVVFSEGDTNGQDGTLNFSTTCNTWYPANRPDVLAVNGSSTIYDSSGNPPSTPTLGVNAWSTSGCTVDVLSGSSYVARFDNEIGAVAPGFAGLSYFWYSSSSFGYNGNTFHGSSFAAPAVAGAAALLRDMWYELGYGIRNNYFLKTDLMMLTDGYAFTSYSDGGTPRLRGGTSPYSGPGRLQLRSLYDFPHGSWQWSWTNLNIANGTLWTKTIPSNIQNYRFAMFWEETDLSHAADIDVWVDALNSTGAICASFIAGQTDFSIVNAIHLKAADIPACALSGGSLQLSVHGYAVPSGQNRVARFSDLWDNEPTY